jgi:curved DNA-binding protein CbpA
LDPEYAAARFREVVKAYETLSDESSRRIYDRTGVSSSEQGQQRNGRQQNNQNNNWWSWTSGRSRQQQSNDQWRRYHRYYFDPYYRVQIMDAQSRVINVHSISHFTTITTSTDESDVFERFVLMAFYDSSIKGCEEKLQFQVLYPWPFAGFSRDGGEGMWWGK